MKKQTVKSFMSWALALALFVTAMPLSLIAAADTGANSAVAVLTENTTEFLGGDGSEENPYIIANKTHLNNVRKYLNSHFKMVADIVFMEADFAEDGAFYNGGQGFESIGSDINYAFYGVFDGGGHTIMGVRISSTDGYVGIFGYNTGIIKNLGLSDTSVYDSYSYTYAGGIVGYNEGTISNCYNTGSVSASAYSRYSSANVGGIAGYNEGTISNCYNAGSVSVSSTYSYAYAGGIAGYNYKGTISNCYNIGSVSASSSDDYSSANAGGIVGQNHGTISNCYNTGSVPASASSTYSYAYAGGIAGDNGGTISNCYNTGSVSTFASSKSSFDNAGGIAGRNYGTISNCYYLYIILKGAGSGTDIAVKCTLEAMKQQSTFAGFDFESIWEMRKGNSYPFPTLRKLPYTDTLEENISDFAGGNGTAYNPYIIETKAHLNNVRNYLGAHFKMVEDIEFIEADFAKNGAFYNGSQGWKPIGTDDKTPFMGVFDGNGHTVMGVHISSIDKYAGIFGYNTGIIKNLGLSDSSVLTSSSYYSAYAGGIAGYNWGIISNCYNIGSVSASPSSSYTYAGGIAGYNNNGTISNCYNTGSVSASSAGGIAGYNWGTISNCYYLDSISKGVGSGTDTAVKYTLEEMKQQKNFVGFDFHTVWEIDGYKDYLYPQLKNNRQEKIQSIELLTLPENHQVIEGLLKDLSGATVKITYEDGFEVTAGVTNQMLSELNPNQIGIQTVHLTYGGQVTDETIEIEVMPKSIMSISVTKLPDKTTYVQDQPINPAGGELTVYYNNNTSKTVFLSDAQLSYPPERTGAVTVTAEYYGFTANFSITVNEKQIKSMSIVAPTKLVYIEGQQLDLTGGKLLVTYVSEDNYSEEIPLTSSMVTGFDPYLLDIQVLTVNYLDQSTNFVVRVVAKSLSEIEVIKKPDKLYYLEAKDALNVTGGKIALVYNNGTSEEINMTYDMVSGFDNTITGTQTLTVTYDGKQAFFDITIISVPLPVPKLVSKTATSVTLEDFEGFEYSIDGIDWQDEPVFTGLRPETEYSFYQRIKATDNSDASPSSPVLKVTTESALVKGDINGDGSVDIRDLVRLKKMASSGGYSHSADLIPDDVINALDLAEMRKYLLGVKIYF